MKNQLLSSLVIASCVSFLTATTAGAVSETHAHESSGMASCTQDLTPPKQIEMYLDGFHCLKSELNLPKEKQLQVHAAHYCAHHGDVFMCSVYDGTGPDARLVAVEYVVGNDVYQKLSPAEKKYWHPHNEEVDTGLLRMPGLEREKEKATLAFLKSTWGKTWQVWPNLADTVPIGEPKLLWSILPEKINAETLAAKEKRDAANDEKMKTSSVAPQAPQTAAASTDSVK